MSDQTGRRGQWGRFEKRGERVIQAVPEEFPRELLEHMLPVSSVTVN